MILLPVAQLASLLPRGARQGVSPESGLLLPIVLLGLLHRSSALGFKVLKLLPGSIKDLGLGLLRVDLLLVEEILVLCLPLLQCGHIVAAKAPR